MGAEVAWPRTQLAGDRIPGHALEQWRGIHQVPEAEGILRADLSYRGIVVLLPVVLAAELQCVIPPYLRQEIADFIGVLGENCRRAAVVAGKPPLDAKT